MLWCACMCSLHVHMYMYTYMCTVYSVESYTEYNY